MQRAVVIALTFVVVVSLGISGYLLMHKSEAERVAEIGSEAMAGDAAAQFNLGFMYLKGQGVPESYVQTYAWLNISAANGNENGKELKAELAELMTKEQIAKAQDLSREMIEANPKLLGD